MATAMPRRRTNQCDMSAISGPKRGRAAEPDQQAMRERDLPERGRQPDRDIAEAERQRPEHQRHGDAEAVGEPAHEHAAAGEAEHGERVGQRGIGAVDAELGLDGRQRHHHRPHADAADGAEQHGDAEAQPGFRGIGRVRLGPAGGCAFWNHGEDIPGLLALLYHGTGSCASREKLGARFLIIILSY